MPLSVLLEPTGAGGSVRGGPELGFSAAGLPLSASTRGTLCPQKPGVALTRAAFVCSKRHSARKREEPALSVKKVHLGVNCHQQTGTVITEHQTISHEVRLKCVPRALFPS